MSIENKIICNYLLKWPTWEDVSVRNSFASLGAMLLQVWYIYQIFKMPLFIPGQQIICLALDHILLMPWWAECHLCSTCFRKFGGITIWSSIRTILFVTFNQFPFSSVSVDWGSKWLVDSSAEKAQLVSFDQSNYTSATDVKMI